MYKAIFMLTLLIFLSSCASYKYNKTADNLTYDKVRDGLWYVIAWVPLEQDEYYNPTEAEQEKAHKDLYQCAYIYGTYNYDVPSAEIRVLKMLECMKRKGWTHRMENILST